MTEVNKNSKPSITAFGLRCIDCSYSDTSFRAKISGIENGTFTYVAQCPMCESLHIMHLPGFREVELSIGVTKLRAERKPEIANTSQTLMGGYPPNHENRDSVFSDPSGRSNRWR